MKGKGHVPTKLAKQAPTAKMAGRSTGSALANEGETLRDKQGGAEALAPSPCSGPEDAQPLTWVEKQHPQWQPYMQAPPPACLGYGDPWQQQHHQGAMMLSTPLPGDPTQCPGYPIQYWCGTASACDAWFFDHWEGPSG